ncbi:tRNA modification GTPase TrmE [Candidatus Glomeribacter gigasporarum BEG34]|uniref:tRNA modification GTPase MnmE n=1 Tax=Candidatus Glomeribacter gigasporarum BEG34 TaxID=1070319 RepID=G2J8D3_9BURK|nr:tRNA uridine-5-carboxymethylaminomethyl(34) synthesis GTPase MnmE [Candidatus Glomeribacter gigasporarum]CCD29030.1 tRNA modification GTPase TrmE [Candidatus Glomeribacter gigasporarum BEG34]
MAIRDHEPIAAIATAPGRGGIGVVRISFGGKDAHAVNALMTALFGQRLIPRHASYVPFLDANGEALDRGIGLYFPAPRSYTGEHTLELHGHGGPIVLQLVLQRCLEAGQAFGMRLAEPGEFTRRAFLNDKLDLAQAEAVADLIEAHTSAAARSAQRSLEGEFSRAVCALIERLTSLRALVEATLDFPEEEIDVLSRADAHGQLTHLRRALEEIRRNARQGALLREGLTIVIAGRPNVGKSSLLNALAGAERAIVTPIAGTTRDQITQSIQIEGIPLHIIDTAGLRTAKDEVERMGIERAWQEIKRAGAILHVLDASTDATPDDQAIAARLPASAPVIRVFNKTDLTPIAPCVEQVNENMRTVRLSAKFADGIDLLRAQLLEIAGGRTASESVYSARQRHLDALAVAGQHLDAAGHAARDAQALDLFAEELRLAQQQLSSMSGEFTPDDLLGEIFSRFCIGK